MKDKENDYLGVAITIFAEGINDEFHVWGVGSSLICIVIH